MEGNSITGFKDTDKIVIQNMDTLTFLNTYKIQNKYLHSLFDENIFKHRTEREFPRLLNLKGNKTWKRFYLELTHWSNLLSEKYYFNVKNFEHHPETYYYIIDDWFGKLDKKNKKVKDFERQIGYKFGSAEYTKSVLNGLLIMASGLGFVDLINFAINNGADAYHEAISEAESNDEDETVKYLQKFLV